MNKQTLRVLGWAAGALLVTFNAFVVPGCGSDDSPSQPIITSGSGGSTPDGGTGGSAGTSGAGGIGGSSATGGSGSTGGSTGGTSGGSGTGGTDQDAGGNAGTAGVGGEAGFGSAPLNDGGDAEAGGAGGSDADAGGAAGYSSAPNDDAGDAETGSGGTSGSGGSSGTGGSNTGGTGSTDSGTGGTIVVPCPADCSNHGSCDTSNGTCTCDTGFNTPDCGSCATGYKNYPTCYAVQACPADCSGHGTCNDQTGTCSCDTGFDTASCGACASGFTGYPKCNIVPQPFTCNNATRHAAFDQFKIDGEQADLTGGIWGTDNSNVYVTAASYSKGVVAHWNGSTWLNEALATTISGSPATAEEIHEIWGSGPNDIWAAARGNSGTQGMLFHKTTGSWVEDLNEPYAKSFESIWGSDSSNVFVTGWKTTGYKVWRKSGTSWMDTGAPTSSTGYGRFYHVWGLDPSNVFVTGEESVPVDGGGTVPVAGFLIRWNGSTWSKISVPAECASLQAIHGSSTGDLWASGSTTTGKGVVYHVTNNLATWTPYVNENTYGYTPIFSARTGTTLALGGSEPLQPGNLKITTIDQVSQPATYAADGLAYGPGVAVWYNAGKAWFPTISPNAGVYTLDCN
ncbi:hypothetical protein HZC53_03595 [Candidatus Uhrbacteria bacterium]|nr:hypothetical protein [Candidatus Uhrbacteria bacterium]